MKQFARQLRSQQTDAERALWRHLRGRNIDACKFRRQEVIGEFIVDFVCLDRKLIVEVDGSQHMQQSVADQSRTAGLERRGYRIIRFWNHEILCEIEAVLERIAAELIDSPHPSLLPEGEGVQK